MLRSVGAFWISDLPKSLITGLLCLALLVPSAIAQAKDTSIEYAVKATYLYKFTPFIQWPSSAFPSPSSPFYVCVLGADPFGPALDQAVNGQRVDDHPVAVRRIQHIDAADGCHILYVANLRKSPASETLRRLRGTPVLTVTEQGQDGGIIQFVVKDGRVRFDIDAAAAAVNQVAISSKLLGLARSVKSGE